MIRGRQHYASFRELAGELDRTAGRTFVHYWSDPSYVSQLPPQFRPKNSQWDLPGAAGQSVVPKYLYRGEAGAFPGTLPSRARITNRFDAAELELLDELTSMASWVWRLRMGDAFRAVGWPQHYGFPTAALDLTSDPAVALHFAADTREQPRPGLRVVHRLDLEAIEPKIYAPEGLPTPLQAASIANDFCVRAQRQSAWVLRSAEDRKPSGRDSPFAFQRSEDIAGHLERFTVDAADADEFVRNDLLDSSSDLFACWPLAVVRSFKTYLQRPLPRQVAEWIVERIPLFEQTPVCIYYDAKGRGSRWQLLSPAEASQRYGHSYDADRESVLRDLMSPDLPAPSGLLFGVPTGGPPNTQRWVSAGDECEVQWRYPFPGPPRYNGRTFEKVIIR
jgi:hypothetical protein